MSISLSLSNQLANSIETLKKAIDNSDEEVWVLGEPPFFQIVFHVINSLDMYFTTFDPEFTDLPDDYQLPEYLQKYSELGFFDNDNNTIHHSENIISRTDLSRFLDSTRTKLRDHFSKGIEDQFNDPSGFSWLKMSKFELIVHNIRHIMAHTGVLNEYLKNSNCEITGWVGRQEL